jgi:hypothetical protein
MRWSHSHCNSPGLPLNARRPRAGLRRSVRLQDRPQPRIFAGRGNYKIVTGAPISQGPRRGPVLVENLLSDWLCAMGVPRIELGSGGVVCAALTRHWHPASPSALTAPARPGAEPGPVRERARRCGLLEPATAP